MAGQECKAASEREEAAAEGGGTWNSGDGEEAGAGGAKGMEDGVGEVMGWTPMSCRCRRRRRRRRGRGEEEEIRVVKQEGLHRLPPIHLPTFPTSLLFFNK